MLIIAPAFFITKALQKPAPSLPTMSKPMKSDQTASPEEYRERPPPTEDLHSYVPMDIAPIYPQNLTPEDEQAIQAAEEPAPVVVQKPRGPGHKVQFHLDFQVQVQKGILNRGIVFVLTCVQKKTTSYPKRKESPKPRNASEL